MPGMGFGFGFGFHRRSSGPTTDFFVDSVNGDDSNDGTTEETAFQTLGAFETSVNAHSGAVLGALLGSSSWREQLVLTRDDATLQVSGALVEVFADEVLAGWSKTSGQTNVYEATFAAAVTGANNEFYILWEDDVELVRRASIADADANAGSYYADVTTDPANHVIYVHTTNSDDPAANGSTYEHNYREYGISLSDNNLDVSNNSLTGPIHVRRPLGNNGFNVGPSSTLRQVLMEGGHKHHMLQVSGSLIDSILYDESRNKQTTQSNMWVGFFDENATPGPHTVSFIRAFWIGVPSASESTENTVPVFWHTLNGGSYSSFTFDQAAFYKLKSPMKLAPTTTVKNALMRLVNGGSPGSGACTWQRTIFQGGGGFGGFGSTGVQTVTDCAFLTESDGCWAFSGSANDVFTNCTSYVTRHQPAQKAAGEPLTLNKSVVIQYNGSTGGQQLLEVDSTNYAGDHNVFHRDAKANRFLIKDSSDGTDVTSLSDWQTKSGQDANSVYLTDAQLAAFFLGTPGDGDLRINPSAEVTGGDGTVYTGEFPDGTPITEAGQQEHWNWNTRAIVDGPIVAVPTIPISLADCRSYVSAPASWDFYP